MWKAYCFGKQGIAIASTIGKLQRFAKKNPGFTIVPVTYNLDEEMTGATLDLFRYKGPEYFSENELRIIGAMKINETMPVPGLYKYNLLESTELVHGFNLDIDPENIIDEIYINSGDPWLKTIVENLIKGRYDIRVSVSNIS
jgi:hypothetical protein